MFQSHLWLCDKHHWLNIWLYLCVQHLNVQILFMFLIIMCCIPSHILSFLKIIQHCHYPMRVMFSCCVLIASSSRITSQLIPTKIAWGEVWSIWLCNHLLTFSCCGYSNPWSTILEKYSFLWCAFPLLTFSFSKISC